MSDTSWPVVMHYGTAAERAAFTPSPPATGQPLYIWRETDTGNVYLYDTSWHLVGVAAVPVVPQGRLTLTTGVPVMVASVTAQGTIYYTPYNGNQVPIYDGSAWNQTTFTELSQTTTDNTKSPAAVANNSNYDLFVWNDGGTIRCTRGPAWTSDTARGTGAGTTELARVNGILMNAVNITNGPAAQRGTYVGSVRSNGTATIDMIFGGAGAAGGEQTIMGVWNMYNRVLGAFVNLDSTGSWTYTTATYRIRNNNNNNKISFIIGWVEDGIKATFITRAANTNTNVGAEITVSLDSVTATSTGSMEGQLRSIFANVTQNGVGEYTGIAPLGFHYVAPLEKAFAAGTCTWTGSTTVAGFNMLARW